MNTWAGELKTAADELNYSFFACDESLTCWSHVSEKTRELFQVSREEIDRDPRFWMEMVEWPPEVLDERLSALAGKGDNGLLTLPFILSEEKVLITLRFGRLLNGEDGAILRLGSAEVFSGDSDYKKEALQARDHEIEISARIQKILLTGAVSDDLTGLEVAAETIPSREVDGDFYEFLPLAPGITDFIIGDVMGKGVPAALLAAGVKASYYKSLITEGLARGEDSDIRDVLQMIDSLISRNLIDLKKFLTLYYCRLNTKKSLLSYIDAGHTSFIYYDGADDSCWSLKGANMPLGFSPSQNYRAFQLPFDRRDLFFFYSDGISEVKDSEGEMFGHERIRQLVKGHGSLSPDELLKKVLNVVFFYAAGTFDDDVTAVAVRITEGRAAPLSERRYEFSDRDSIDLEAVREDFAAGLNSAYGEDQLEASTKLTIALLEACANGISYTEGPLTVGWKLYAGRAEVSISFSGPDYEWFADIPPEPEEYRENGYGSYLIHRGTDSSLLLQGKGNCKKLIMLKEFA